MATAENKVENIQAFDIEELAASLCGIENDDTEKVDEALQDQFNVDLDSFSKIVEVLYRRIDLGVSPLTGSVFIGFTNEERNCWLAKREFLNNFIGCILQWVTEGEKLPVGGGFERPVTNNDKLEFRVLVVHPMFEKWSVYPKRKPKDGKRVLATQFDVGDKRPNSDELYEKNVWIATYVAEEDTFWVNNDHPERRFPLMGVKNFRDLPKKPNKD